VILIINVRSADGYTRGLKTSLVQAAWGAVLKKNSGSGEPFLPNTLGRGTQLSMTVAFIGSLLSQLLDPPPEHLVHAIDRRSAPHASRFFSQLPWSSRSADSSLGERSRERRRGPGQASVARTPEEIHEAKMNIDTDTEWAFTHP
jgi:hypothetical protein